MRTLPVLALLAAAACGGTETSASPDASTSGGGPYPAGPYGKTERSIIAPLEFVDPAGTARSFRDIQASGSAKLILAVTASGWCTSCIEHQPEYEALHNKYKARGFVLFEAVFEDESFRKATAMDASDWKRKYKLTFDVVADPDFKLGEYYDKTLTPMMMFIDARTMEILRIQTGWSESDAEALAQARL